MEDILEKSLKYLGYKVKRVMNITDVGHLTSDADSGEDKMLKGAKREPKSDPKGELKSEPKRALKTLRIILDLIKGNPEITNVVLVEKSLLILQYVETQQVV